MTRDAARPLKVLVAHFRSDIVSGAELAIGDVARSPHAAHRYVMWTPGGGRLADHYREQDHEVWPRELQTRRRRYPGLHSLQSIRWSGEVGKRADLVLCNTFPAASRVGTACRIAGTPYAIYVREYLTDSPLHREILRRADRVFAVSRDVADYLSRIAPRGRITVATDHLDAAPLEGRLERHRRGGGRALPFPRGVPVVGIVGRITRYKRPDLFLKAMARVATEVPDARFVVVGAAIAEEADYASGLRSLAGQLSLGERVAFLGYREDAIEIISELSACCVPSEREPFPRTVLEAQLAGCPVVASDTGGCPEMIEHGATGLLFPALSADAPSRLAGLVIRLLKEPALAPELTSRARTCVLETVASAAPVKALEAEREGMVVRRQRTA